MKSSRLLPYIMGAVIISVSTPFLLLPKPTLAAECNSFGTCTWTERRVHCKSFGRCSAQYRTCSKFSGYKNIPARPQTCGDWKNSL